MVSPEVERASKSKRTPEDVLAERCPECNGTGQRKGPEPALVGEATTTIPTVAVEVFCLICHGTGKKEREEGSNDAGD